ncbi:hypothetical protein [Spirochaeta isovalerica]|uniref:Putative ribosomally synthesized peptide with nif11-like leader n=1 Tax=Spirochaeta isovalerica TaxID=150 RepID=A0A841R571_9SPIO|nr:hypothetical protein [Spirochaeta isovalerica]MBB6480304.1 putative ribosomally synthesized peptide with nif11-like leader [Spirochaeta isovalerica]
MPIKDAENYIREIAVDMDLRKSLYAYSTSAEMMTSIKDSGFNFKLYEFEESINHLKVESPDEEQAIMLEEILLWWKMLMYDGSICEEAKSASCSPSRCFSCSSC